MTANFDRWEADPFFSAAEQVQDSADRLDSIFRNWSCSQNAAVSVLEESWSEPESLRYELQTALGTAKWQLDEFEKAVTESYAEKDSSAKTRHTQFIVAIRNQISCIEKALSNSFTVNNKRGLRWVHLNEQEKDDLALFLSGSEGCKSQDFHSLAAKKTDALAELAVAETFSRRDEINPSCPAADNINGFKETILINRDSKYVVEMSEQKFADSRYPCPPGIALERRCDTRSVPNEESDLGSWKIVISGDTEESSLLGSEHKDSAPQFSVLGLARKLGVPGRLKWSKSGVKRATDMGYSHRSNSITNLVSSNKQFYGWAGAIQRRMQRSHYLLQYSRPIQITWILLVMLCLVGLFAFIVI